MDEKGLKKLNDDLNQKFDDLNELIEKKADSEKLVEMQDGLRKQIGELPDKESQTKQQEQLDSLEEKINELVINQGGDRNAINKSFDAFFKSDGYQRAIQRKGINETFELKASTITTSNSFTETNGEIIVPWRDPQIGVAPRHGIVLTNLVSKGTVGTSDSIDWVERTGETTGTAMTAEGSTFGQSDVSWTSYKYPIELIGDYIKVARIKLADTDFVRSEIMDVLQFNMPHKLETELFDGTGSSNRLYGYIGGSKASSFSLPSGITAVGEANEFDVIRAAMVQIAIGNNSSKTDVKSGFDTQAVIVHPVDYYNMMSRKDANENYVFGLDGLPRILGVPIYQSTRLTAGTYLVGDFSRGKLYIRQGVEIQMWDQEASDAINNLVTFTASMRACLVVKGVDVYASVTGTFATDIDSVKAGS